MESHFYIRSFKIYFIICYTVLGGVVTKLYFYSRQSSRTKTSLRNRLNYIEAFS